MKLILSLTTLAILANAKPPKPTNTCPSNEIFSDCGNACTEKCPTGDDSQIVCPMVCLSRCSCKDGNLRNSKGKCVSLSKCSEVSATCQDPNERWRNLNRCMQSCPVRNCFSGIPEWGCHCRDGYVRDANQNDRCIPQKQCPSVDSTHSCTADVETYRLSSECDNLCKKTKNCNKTKRYGCYCLKGHKLNSKGKCIPKEKCMPHHGHHHHHHSHGHKP